MSDTATVSTGSFLADGFRRGDYISFSGMPQYAATTSGLARGPNLTVQRQRIRHITGSALTVRDAERWPVLEWVLARTEDWIVWPCADLVQRIRHQ